MSKTTHTLEVKAHCIELGCDYAWHGGPEMKGQAINHANEKGHQVIIETTRSYCYIPQKLRK